MSLESAKIVGDVIDGLKDSDVSLKIKYGINLVSNGATIAPKYTTEAPLVYFSGADPMALYTLICTDPDPPDPEKPIYKEWLHWIVINIPGRDGDASAGQEITRYIGPSPPIGVHRYVFMLFEQHNQEPMQVQDPAQGRMGRKQFNTRKFAEKHDLNMPVAATYFLSHK